MDSESKCSPKFNSGPPYSLGVEVLCEANGLVLQWAFVLEADHPQYCLRLHNGQEIDTSVTLVGFMPQYALASDADNPFKDLQMNRGVMNGSFRIQTDVQLDSLQRV